MMASSWCITYLHCSWSPGYIPSSLRIGLDDSPTSFWDSADVRDFGTPSLALPGSGEHVLEFPVPLEKPV